MKAAGVRKVFAEAGMEVPEVIERRLGGEYDLHESYCCGLEARGDSDSVLVWAYCHRGRGSERKPCWLFWPDGSWEERLRRSEDPLWNSESDDEPDPDYGEEDYA